MNDSAAAQRILAIRDDEPERLFHYRLSVDDDYRALAKIWHPDRSTGDDAVFAKIGALRAAAQKRRDAGLPWRVFGLDDRSGVLLITTTSGEKWKVPYVRRHSSGYGDHYVGRRHATFLTPTKLSRFFERGERLRARITPADPLMRYAAPQLAIPQFRVDDYLGAMVPKPSNGVLLRDLLSQQGGKMDPKHVAWIVSRAYWFACLLHVNECVSASLSPDDLYVDPADHAAVLAGGWWAAFKIGEKMDSVPRRSLSAIGAIRLRDRVATPGVGTDLVRALGRELLGDPGGSRMLYDDTIPAPLRSWLTYPGTDHPTREYEKWQKEVLPSSFGERRFEKLNINFTDVYQTGD